jgi:hypothetical protein
MDESTRQALGAIFFALAGAAGEFATEDACDTLVIALDSGAVDDPAARAALATLVRLSASDKLAEVKGAIANLTQSAGALSNATGDDSFARITAHIGRRISRITPSTPVDEIRAIADMVEAVEAAASRIKVDA